MGLLDAFADPQFRKDVVRGLLDAGNRGAVAGLLGGPVDLATMAMRPFGYNVEQPVGGSEWIGQKMQNAGFVSPERNRLAEALAGVAIPAAANRLAPTLFAAEQKAAQNLAAPNRMNAATRGQAGAIVWHGSPHKFDKFDSSKIGTGEGAQAYGHGLYLAESPEVAKSYATNLANRDMANQGRLNAHANAQRLANLAGDAKYAADDVRYVLESAPDHPQKELLSETLKFLESGAYKTPLSNPGSLYKVDLPDDQIARMLDWDKPLSQQAPEVQAALSAEAQKYINRGAKVPDAGMIVRGMQPVERFGGSGAVSEMLRLQGIPGIRYLDGGSRGAGTGTSNFVVFPGNEDLLRILERNGVPLP